MTKDAREFIAAEIAGLKHKLAHESAKLSASEFKSIKKRLAALERMLER